MPPLPPNLASLHTTWPLPSPEGERYLPPRGEEKRKKVPEPEEPRYLCAPGCQTSADVRHLSCSSSPCVPTPAGQRRASARLAQQRRNFCEPRAAAAKQARSATSWRGREARGRPMGKFGWCRKCCYCRCCRQPGPVGGEAAPTAGSSSPELSDPGRAGAPRSDFALGRKGRAAVSAAPLSATQHSTAQSAERAGNASSRWGRRPGAPGLPLPGSESGRERKARLISCYSARGLILLGSSQRSGESGENKGLLWGMSRALSQLVKVAF